MNLCHVAIALVIFCPSCSTANRANQEIFTVQDAYDSGVAAAQRDLAAKDPVIYVNALIDLTGTDPDTGLPYRLAGPDAAPPHAAAWVDGYNTTVRVQVQLHGVRMFQPSPSRAEAIAAAKAYVASKGLHITDDFEMTATWHRASAIDDAYWSVHFYPPSEFRTAPDTDTAVWVSADGTCQGAWERSPVR